MMTYVLISGGLFLGCVTATLVNMSTLGVALFPIPVGVYLVRHRVDRALGLIMCAGLSAWVSIGTFRAVVYYALLAAVGLPLGIGIARRWTYGWTVLAMAALAYAVAAADVLTAWQEWRDVVRTAYEVMIAELQHQAQEVGNESVSQAIQLLAWLKDHRSEVGLGLIVWPLSVTACIGVSATTLWLRKRHGTGGVQGSFREMRTSEWTVWAVIGIAVLWFVDRQWPLPALRLISWNAAIGLAAVYWLNGLSIMVYAADMLRYHLLMYAAAIVIMVSFVTHPMVCFVGLFDTWVDFRHVLDGIVAARKKKQESERSDDE